MFLCPHISHNDVSRGDINLLLWVFSRARQKAIYLKFVLKLYQQKLRLQLSSEEGRGSKSENEILRASHV